MVTVKDILKLPELQDAIIEAGKFGLQNEIRWVHVIDHEDVGRYLEGRELLLSCGQVWPDTQQAEERLLDSFLQNQIAGMVFATGTYIKEIPSSVLDFGVKHDIPVLEVPFHISFVQMSQSILQKVMNVKHESSDFKDQVLKNVLDKLKWANRTAEICRVLSTNLGSYAIMTNSQGQVFTGTMIEGVKYHHVRGMVKELMRLLQTENSDLTDLDDDVEANQAIFVPSKQPPYGLCVPLKTRDHNRVYLWLLNDKRPLEKEDEQIVEYAAIMLTYFVLNEQEAEAARRRLRSECLQRLLAETEPNSLAVEEITQELELDSNASWLSGFILSEKNTTSETLVLWRKLCQRWIDETNGVSGFCEFYHEELLFVVSSSLCVDGPGFFEPLHHLLQDIKNGGVPVLVLGRMKQTLHHLSTSYQEATSLAPIVQYRSENGGIYLADDFQREMFLYSSFDTHNARAFRDLILPKELFSQKGAPLYETLKCLSLYSYNRDQVAKALHIHRNTLQYRIKRIEYLLEDHLSSPQCQFWVRVALDLESLAKKG